MNKFYKHKLCFIVVLCILICCIAFCACDQEENDIEKDTFSSSDDTPQTEIDTHIPIPSGIVGPSSGINIDPISPSSGIIAEPTDPVVEPTDPVVEPTPPVVEPTDPSSGIIIDPKDTERSENGSFDTPKEDDPTDPDVDTTDQTDIQVDPVDPVVEPTDPIIDPQPTELDFSGLEEKICEVILSTRRNITINDFSYSISGNKFYILVDMDENVINLFSATIDNLKFKTQEDIDSFVEIFNKNMLDKTSDNVTKKEISFVKAQSDITVNGETYSKDGIEGDNPFARQCGVENAYMTYVSDVGIRDYYSFESGYGHGIKVLVIEKNENEPIVTKCDFVVEGATSTTPIENLFIDGKNDITTVQTIFLGKNIKEDSEYIPKNKYDDDIDGFEYEQNGNEITILGPGNNRAENINIPAEIDGKKVTEIGYSAFEGCTNIKKIVLPETILKIDGFAFVGCKNLEEINIPNSVAQIDDYAFKKCSSLKEISLGNNVQTLGRGSFASCTSLESIYIPVSITKIKERVFDGCDAFENVYYSGSVEKWCSIIFSDTTSNPLSYAENFYIYGKLVETLYISNLNRINDFAFCNYNKLSCVTILNVKKMGACVFYGCNNLQYVSVGNELTNTGLNVFKNCSQLTSIKYKGTLKQYENIKGDYLGRSDVFNIDWNTFATIYCTDGTIAKK